MTTATRPATGDPFAPLQHWFDWATEHWLELVIAITAGLVIYLALGLLKRVLVHLFRKASHTTPITAVFASAAHFPAREDWSLWNR